MGDEFLKQSVLSAIWRPFCFRKHDSGQRSWRKSFIYKLQRNLRLTEISWANRLSACALLVVALNGISIIDLRIKQLCHYSIRVSLSMSETTISRTFQCISSSSHCYSCRLRWTESIQLLKTKEDGKKNCHESFEWMAAQKRKHRKILPKPYNVHKCFCFSRRQSRRRLQWAMTRKQH